MSPNKQFSVDLDTFIERTLNGKLRFLCSVYSVIQICSQDPRKNLRWKVLEQWLTLKIL